MSFVAEMMPRQNMALWNIPEQQIFPSVKASDKPLSHQMYNGTSSSYPVNSEMSTRYNLNQDDMNHLDAAFQRLRDVLPRNDALLNTSKVGIINSASEYIDLLLAEIIVLEKETAICSDVKQTLMGDEVIGELPEPVLERVLENIEDFPIDDLLCGDAQHKVATPSYGSEIADAREIQNSDRVTPVSSDGDDNGQNKNNNFDTSNGTSIDQAGRGTDGKSDAVDHGEDDDDDVDVDDDSIDVGNHSDHHPGKHLKDAREENRVTSDESRMPTTKELLTWRKTRKQGNPHQLIEVYTIEN
ncbi:uncharacterized protein [Ptychodera flava]|uniref:uncharacterized protein n=1 Tax=Ptychodera flava TaxID=63121 RepID=UPI00396A3460